MSVSNELPESWTNRSARFAALDEFDTYVAARRADADAAAPAGYDLAREVMAATVAAVDILNRGGELR